MKPRKFAIAIFGFALGVFTTTAQITLLRFAFTLGSGNELLLGAAWFAWLSSAAIGAIPARRLALSPATLAVAAFLATLVCVAALLLLRVPLVHLHLVPGERHALSALLLYIGATILPTGALGGFLFVAGVRWTTRTIAPNAFDITYIAEATGALFSGLITAFIAIGRVEPIALNLAAGCLLCSAAFHLNATRSHTWRAALMAFASLAALGFGLTPHPERLQDALAARVLPSIHGTLRATAEGPYGRIALFENEGLFALTHNGQNAHNFPDPYDAPLDIHLALSIHPSPQRVLFIEGAPSDRLAAAHHHGVTHIDALALDATADDLSRDFWTPETRRILALPGVRRLYGDSRPFLRRHPKRYDVIIAAPPPPESAESNRLHTREFFADAASALAPAGVLVFAAPGSANYFTDTALQRLAGQQRTMSAVFPHVAVIPGQQALFVGAVSEAPDLSAAQLMAHFHRCATPQARIVPEQLIDPVDPARIAQLDAALRHTEAPVNRDHNPTAYLEEMRRDAEQRDDVFPIPQTLRHPLWLVGILPLLLFTAVLLGLFRRRHASTVLTLFSTGVCGMAGELIILVSFGAAYGQVYTGMAWIIAAFMAGLSLGAVVATRLPPRRGVLSAVEGCTLLILVAMAVGIPHLGHTPLFFAAITVLLGGATGATFPLFVKAARQTTPGVPFKQLLGRFVATDSIGAALGALLTSLFWMPQLGLLATCLLLAAWKGLSLATHLFFSSRSAA
ncbi:MAG: hypothetical protein GX146_00350 [Myxococcales bacterium]|jgi:spermidine synthase|nr:hypothetical protein [Myxococcales bacterium]